MNPYETPQAQSSYDAAERWMQTLVSLPNSNARIAHLHTAFNFQNDVFPRIQVCELYGTERPRFLDQRPDLTHFVQWILPAMCTQSNLSPVYLLQKHSSYEYPAHLQDEPVSYIRREMEALLDFHTIQPLQDGEMRRRLERTWNLSRKEIETFMTWKNRSWAGDRTLKQESFWWPSSTDTDVPLLGPVVVSNAWVELAMQVGKDHPSLFEHDIRETILVEWLNCHEFCFDNFVALRLFLQILGANALFLRSVNIRWAGDAAVQAWRELRESVGMLEYLTIHILEKDLDKGADIDLVASPAWKELGELRGLHQVEIFTGIETVRASVSDIQQRLCRPSEDQLVG